MSAILSSDDLNDFISPGVACIKPVETLPAQDAHANVYEVTTEDKVASDAPPAHISLTDCLACSGCVTSAEAVLISLQSHAEVLSILDSEPSIPLDLLRSIHPNGSGSRPSRSLPESGKIFVISVSPQVRASLAATYGVSAAQAGNMVERLLVGPRGLGSGGKFGNRFAWIVDTSAMRELGLVMAAEEMIRSQSGGETGDPKKPILASACPGWVCYAEKTHPHILPHLSRLKSPQALTGTVLKTVLSKALAIDPSRIWHLAVMPCFDKKLEASRQELTDASWRPPSESSGPFEPPVRDVDCVITARELLMLADSRGIIFPSLPRTPLESSHLFPFPNEAVSSFLFPKNRRWLSQSSDSGPSGGFLFYNLCMQQSLHPGSSIRSQRGRNADIVEYSVERGNETLFRAARYYGFRNIQNLVRKLKPPKVSRMGGKLGTARKPDAKPSESRLAYVEVMACPGGCTNGGGQIKLQDLEDLQGAQIAPETQKDWLTIVDEAYFSMEEDGTLGQNETMAASVRPGIQNSARSRACEFLEYWSSFTEIDAERLIYTSFRAVESDVGKQDGSGTERVAEIASKIGGGW